MKEIFSSGGGTQSAAIAALIVAEKLPKPDFVVIADTGYERPSTWIYLDSVIRPELGKIGLEVHRVFAREWETTNDVFSTKGEVLMPMFSSKTVGVSAKLKNYCTTEWKIRVINRFLRSKGVETKDQRKWIGFSLNEIRRTLALMDGEEYKLGRLRLPLVHDVPMRRDQAISFVVNKMGWPIPPRSACWFCPNQTDLEWSTLTSEELKAARCLEIKLQAADPFVWFHKSCVPIDEVNFEQHPEFNFDVPCDSGVCFV